MRRTGEGEKREQKEEKEQRKGKDLQESKEERGRPKGGETERKRGTGDRGTGWGVQRKTRREQAKRWRLGESKRQPGSSAALNSFDPVRLARRSSRYIPVVGWAQSERERQREIVRERSW